MALSFLFAEFASHTLIHTLLDFTVPQSVGIVKVTLD